MARIITKVARSKRFFCYENMECEVFSTYDEAKSSEKFNRPVYLVCKLIGYGGMLETLDEVALFNRPTVTQVKAFINACDKLLVEG